jgi:hypothetical protein
MHGSMSAAGGNQASRLSRAAQAPPADPTATRALISALHRAQRQSARITRSHSGTLVFVALRVGAAAPGESRKRLSRRPDRNSRLERH